MITKYNHIKEPDRLTKEIRVIESAHPVPDPKTVCMRASNSWPLLNQYWDTESLVMLISGGASALAEHLPADTGLDELQQVTQTLIADGYGIDRINRLRCQLSQIKGGRLLQNFKGRSVFTYAISDVPDDDIRVIGSGIGANQAIVWDDSQYPASIRPILDKAGKTRIPSSTATGFDYRGRVIASNSLARNAIAQQAVRQGYQVIINQDLNRVSQARKWARLQK